MTKPKKPHGEGSLRQLKSGTWQYRVSLGKDPVTGKDIRRNVSGKNKADVIKRASRLKSDHSQQVAARCKPIIIADYAELWLKNKSLEVKARTLYNYRYDLSQYILPSLGKVALATLEPAKVKQLQLALASERGIYTSNRAIMRVLSNMLNDAIVDGHLATNPCALIKPLKQERLEQPILSGAEVKRFLEAAKESTRLYALFFVALTTGMRQGELLALTWDNVVFFDGEGDAGEIRITKSAVHMAGKRTGDGTPKTKTALRTIGFSAKTKEVLLAQKQLLAEESKTAGYRANNYVFPNAVGGHLAPNNLMRAIDAVVARAAVKRITFHGFRHTFASMMIANGYDPVTVAALLGHNDAAITLRTYAKFYERKKRPQMKELEDLI